MNLKRCENGHFYDADKFAACPHCTQQNGGGAASRPTMAAEGVAAGGAVTMPASALPPMGNASAIGNDSSMGSNITIPDSGVPRGGSIAESVRNVMTVPETMGEPDDDNKTIRFTEKSGTDPVVGWLVGIEGEYFGESFKLKTGRNFIGRNHDMDIVLAKDHSVSRDKHAIVLYEPKKREFLTQPGDSRSLFYLNDDVVLMTEKLKHGDILTLGESKLMFIPCCGPDFGWDMLNTER